MQPVSTALPPLAPFSSSAYAAYTQPAARSTSSTTAVNPTTVGFPQQQPPPPSQPVYSNYSASIANAANAAASLSYMNFPAPGMVLGQTPMVYYPPVGVEAKPDEVAEVPRCHLHSKPQLKCKLCRKYKSAVYQIGRIGQAQEAQRPTEDRKNMVEMTDSQTFNVNNLLRGNILSSEYFKSLYSLKHYSEVVDELYQYADHAEPYVTGNTRAPSTLFCCLYKFFTMKLTEKQVSNLLDHVDSPYIRAAGFLYLRYVHPAEKLWKWYEPYFLDDEEFTPGSDKTRKITMGEYVESLITEDKYFNTVLPRLPVKIKNLYGAQLIAMDEHRKRKKANKLRIDHFTEGAAISACSNGDWLDGEILDIDESLPGRMSILVKLEDGNEEIIDIGLVLLQEKKSSKSRDHKKSKHKSKKSKTHSGKRSHSRSRSRERHGRSHSRSRSRSNSMKGTSKFAPKTQEELLNEFRRREREKALATGKDYARRPTSYKSSLSLKIESCSIRKRTSPSLSPVRYNSGRDRAATQRASSPARNEYKKKEPSLEHKYKMAQLIERYSKVQADVAQRRTDEEGPDVMRLG